MYIKTHDKRYSKINDLASLLIVCLKFIAVAVVAIVIVGGLIGCFAAIVLFSIRAIPGNPLGAYIAIFVESFVFLWIVSHIVQALTD